MTNNKNEFSILEYLKEKYTRKNQPIDKEHFDNNLNAYFYGENEAIKEINKARAYPLKNALEMAKQYKNKKGYANEVNFYKKLYKYSKFNKVKDNKILLSLLSLYANQPHYFTLMQNARTFYDNDPSEQLLKEQAINNIISLQDYKIKLYEEKERTLAIKSNIFGDMKDSDEIILHGLKVGSFEDIKTNIYYALDGVDHILAFNIWEQPEKSLIGSFTAKYVNNPHFYTKELIKIDSKTTLKEALTNNQNKLDPQNPKVNTALLYALFTQRSTTDKGQHTKGYKYRKALIVLIQAYIYINLLLESATHNNETIKRYLDKKGNTYIFKNDKNLEKYIKNFINYRYFLLQKS
ncbi:hypothetical protein [Campylobacter vicugnae]|uniref:hypothetical protein n=1 Tax=Campylobacter vicugnae TaxID=1660076 RepID=UPI00254E85BE|nr:hypothetical protein [Campylobacter ovis]MDL0096098.1 hypothetical protein [Campylobacter ovis]